MNNAEKKTFDIIPKTQSRWKPIDFFFIQIAFRLMWFSIFYLFPVTKFIRIGIADKNDNPPYFDKALYEAEVDENEDIQHTVLTVTAKDHDECKYYIGRMLQQ